MNSLVMLPLFFAAAMAGWAPQHHALIAAPAVAVANHGVHAVARTQHHAQDAYTGTYDYGYAEPNSAKREIRHLDGTVTGSYTVPLPDGRVLQNNYVADEHGFRSSLAPTALNDFAPRVKAAYSVHAPVLAQTVGAVAVPQPALHLTKTVNYAAPALVKSYAPIAAPLAYGAPYGYGRLHY